MNLCWISVHKLFAPDISIIQKDSTCPFFLTELIENCQFFPLQISNEGEIRLKYYNRKPFKKVSHTSWHNHYYNPYHELVLKLIGEIWILKLIGEIWIRDMDPLWIHLDSTHVFYICKPFQQSAVIYKCINSNISLCTCCAKF